MEVILLEKIKHLGNLGDKVVVKNGYARNYLVPHNKAVLANANNLADFEARRSEFEKAQQSVLESSQDRADQFKEIIVEIAGKVGVEGEKTPK